MVTPLVHPAPPRGTRPKDRRSQIRTAAAALFYERGYGQVSVADVAASVNVGPSALYRHYSGKAQLLYEAIDVTINAFSEMVGQLPTRDLEGIALTSARTATAHRALGVLWQREARNLPADQQAVLRHRLREAVGALAETLREIRPELSVDQAAFLAAAGVNTMNSISFHRLSLPEDEMEELLAALTMRVLTYPFPPPPRASCAMEPEAPRRTRREEIGDAAVRLFAEHGFDAVSLDDVGAAIGIAGPSIYRHFASKQDLLHDSLGRGFALLQDSLVDAIEQGTSPADRLRRLSDSYVGLTLRASDLITNLIAESRNLAPEHAEMAQLAQLGYIGRWVDLVRAIRPEEPATVARIKVQAAQMTASSLARTTYLRGLPGFAEDVREICWRLQQ
ncbi:MAG: TetR/AcrR family transcriptional regulator [Marmoricola sp.]